MTEEAPRRPAAAATPAPAAQAEPVFRFGTFQVQPAQRTLLEDGRPLRLGSRAFDLLVALCQRAGEVVSTRELLAAAWPNQVVEEGSVRVHIANLRKALGDGVGERRFVSNVPLRGYCFVAPVERVAAPRLQVAVPAPAASPPTGPAASPARWRLQCTASLIGREREADALLQEMSRHRCVTLVGPGGIGKTSVALVVARRLGDLDGVDVVLVELAALSRPDLVPMAIASALGVVVPEHEPLPAIAAVLQGERRHLIVLDNCEHVIDGVAAAAEHILFHAPGARLLVTSRESLRVHGEWVHRLEPLSLPPPSQQGKAADALQYSAIRLFVERAAAGASGFAMDDDVTPLVCNICRRLDGIPLAIELAAGAIEAVGLKGLVERLGGRLGNRLVVIGRGRRTALPRQQTLRATLDWSHDLLPHEEQALLAHLSIFRGVFTHEGALAVFDRPPALLDDCLASLVSKSMVVSEMSGDAVVYRLLETTREYAGERLTASAAAPAVAQRHAEHMLRMVRAADQAGEGDDGPHLTLPPARWIDDLREAVHWSFASHDTCHLGVALMARSAPLWFSLSMLAEFRRLAERALGFIEAEPQRFAAAEEEMRLCEALGHALWHTRGGGEAMGSAFRRALAIAESLQATGYRLRCLWGSWLVCNAEGDYGGSRRLAEQFGSIAASRSDPQDQRTFERMMALGAHFNGDQATASTFAHTVLGHARYSAPAARRNSFQFDQRVAAHTVMARVLWVQGLPEQALAHADEAVQQALAIDHALSLCYAVAIGAAPVAFWCGDMARARHWSGLLKQRSDERSLHFWQAYGNGYRHLIEVADGLAAPEALPEAPGGTALGDILSTIHPSFMREPLRRRAMEGAAGWCTAELLRIEGERCLQAGAWKDAVALFEQGIAVARQQQALAWQLRCATGLARLLAMHERRDEARQVIEPVLAQFQEGLETQDLRRARDFVDRELR